MNWKFTTGEQTWSTSKNEFSNKCRNLGQGRKGSLENCKAFCLEKPGCTAFNYENRTTHCVLRGCKLPVVPPAKDRYPTFDGYWQDGSWQASTGPCKVCIMNLSCLWFSFDPGRQWWTTHDSEWRRCSRSCRDCQQKDWPTRAGMQPAGLSCLHQRACPPAMDQV